MNLYCTLDQAKRAASHSGTSRDALWLEQIEGASRMIDAVCGRHFYTASGIRYFDSAGCRDVLYIDDFLSLSALWMDSERDGTFDGQDWAEGEDWVSRPYNHWPKIAIETHVSTAYALASGKRYIKATGVWGFGDGYSGTPWKAQAVTLTVADGATTTATVSTAGVVEAGHTLKVEDEQIYVSAVDGTTLTVVRGVNGTTGAAHTAAAVSTAKYPALVQRACVTVAAGRIARETHSGYKSERIGDYQYTLADEGQEEQFLQRALCGLVRPV